MQAARTLPGPTVKLVGKPRRTFSSRTECLTLTPLVVARQTATLDLALTEQSAVSAKPVIKAAMGVQMTVCKATFLDALLVLTISRFGSKARRLVLALVVLDCTRVQRETAAPATHHVLAAAALPTPALAVTKRAQVRTCT